MGLTPLIESDILTELMLEKVVQSIIIDTLSHRVVRSVIAHHAFGIRVDRTLLTLLLYSERILCHIQMQHFAQRYQRIAQAGLVKNESESPH